MKRYRVGDRGLMIVELPLTGPVEFDIDDVDEISIERMHNYDVRRWDPINDRSYVQRLKLHMPRRFGGLLKKGDPGKEGYW